MNTDHLVSNISEHGFRRMALKQSLTVQSELDSHLKRKYTQLDHDHVNILNRLIRFYAPDFVLFGELARNGRQAFEDRVDSLIPVIRDRIGTFV